MRERTTLPAATDCDSADAKARRIALRRQVLDWRDRWSIEIESQLASLCGVKAADIALWAAQLRTYQLAAARTGFAEYPGLPQIMEDAGELAERMVGKARDELAGVVAHHLEIEARGGPVEDRRDLSVDQVLTIGRGVAPFAAAAAILAALPGLATTTTVSMFGLVTTSTVSLPILTVGVASVGALGYFGVINVADIRARQERTLIEAVEAEIECRLLAKNHENEPSLLARVQQGLAAAADGVLEKMA